MSDLPERLRCNSCRYAHESMTVAASRRIKVELEAADEIERLRSQLGNEKYLVWSNEHRCWWRPNSAGYTRKVEDAGRYTRQEAIEISRGRGWPATGIPDEVPVLERDAVACFALPDETST